MSTRLSSRVVTYPRPGDDKQKLQACDYGTDLDASLRFAVSHNNVLRYCRGLGWLYWDGKRWALGGEDRAIELSKLSAREWTTKWMSYNGENRDVRIRTALTLESAPHVKNAVDLAKSDPRLLVKAEKLDTDPWRLNVLNGTLDLRKGGLRPHDRADLITKLAPVTFVPTAKNETLERYLKMLEDHAPGMAAFLARCFGAALTGDASPESLFLLQGEGGSGKTTLVEAMSAMMGGYAVKLQFESFCQSKHGRSPGAASPDLIPLRGARLAYASEGDQSARLDAGVVKTLTGNEPITARALHSPPITFPQTWKLWLVSNFDPKASSEDTGIWRRMLKLHFDVIPEQERDPEVKRVLTTAQEARSALLAWALKGCIDWQSRGGGRAGLAPPEAVQAATNAYRIKQDTLSEWWDDLLNADAVLKSDEWATVGEMRRHYEDWCDETGALPVYVKRFNEYLETHGLVKIRSTAGVKRWQGIKMNN
jgi:putative DNA primase/helicase